MTPLTPQIGLNFDVPQPQPVLQELSNVKGSLDDVKKIEGISIKKLNGFYKGSMKILWGAFIYT